MHVTAVDNGRPRSIKRVRSKRGGRFQKSSVEGVQRPLTASTRKIFETLPGFEHVWSRSTALTHTTRT